MPSKEDSSKTYTSHDTEPFILARNLALIMKKSYMTGENRVTKIFNNPIFFALLIGSKYSEIKGKVEYQSSN